MSTFLELQQDLQKAKQRRQILNYLSDHLETTFRSAPNAKPLKVMLTDDKVAIPDDAFEDVILEQLKEVEQIDKKILSILKATLSVGESK